MSSVFTGFAGVARGSSHPNVFLTAIEVGMAAVRISKNLRARQPADVGDLRLLGVPDALSR